jgi:[protein-PII] uridylyltransferase
VLTDTVRRERARLVADHDRRGADFGVALSTLVDRVLADAFESIANDAPWSVVALGSYARRELTPGSDIDVMLLHSTGRAGGRAGGRVGRRTRAPSADDAGALWYPLWDAGFTLGQSVRSVREALALADDDLDALTSLLDLRLVAGDRDVANDLVRRVRDLAPRRRDRVLDALAAGARDRLVQPGPIAEMLEPELKLGGGGLRDVQAPGWAAWTLPPGGELDTDLLDGDGWDRGAELLVERGYLRPEDPDRLSDARARLLDARVALHRVSGSRSDRLPLQEQDAVATLVGARDADELVRGLGEAARAVVWITRELWSRLLAAEAGPGGSRTTNRELVPGVVLRDGQVGFTPDVDLDTVTVLRAAVHAARASAPFEWTALARLADVGTIEWDPTARDAFLDLLAAGHRAIPVFETLDHVGLLVRLLPEWASVRARPQRNAYHRFTVDRHSLEAVAECAALLDPEDPAGAGFDGEVARTARRDVLLLAALLHDIAKGRAGDHSQLGEAIARDVGHRIGVDADGVEDLAWAVRNHLLLADTATRRDLGDERTISRYGDEVRDAARNAVLYALTIGDSRATGPAAWNASKAALVRELYMKADAHLSDQIVVDDRPDPQVELARLIGDSASGAYLAAMPGAYARAFSPEELARHHALVTAGDPTVEWGQLDDGRWRCTLLEPDRTGLLATAAGALALVGFDIDAAVAYSHPNGSALEVFTGRDRFDRLVEAGGRERATATISDAIEGRVSLDEQLRTRARRYRPRVVGVDRGVRVLVDTDASASATVVEVHAPDEVGLLARVASVFVDLELDVGQAFVSTAGDRVVDVFYLHDLTGTRFEQRHAVEALRATLLSRLTAAITLDGSPGGARVSLHAVSERFSPSAVDLLRWAETLSAIARTGLGFTQSLYEQERFEEVLKVAADIRHVAVEEAEAETLFEDWMASVGQGTQGYVTPKLAVAAIVANERSELLLTQRADSGVWLYPVGYADVGYSPSEIAVKEVHEETGIEVEPLSVIAVLDGLRLGFARMPLYSLLFHCRMIGGELRGHPLETRAVGFFGRDNLPWPVAGIERWGELAFAAIDGEVRPCDFDLPRTPPWRGES